MSVLDLIKEAPVALDRSGWARRGTPGFDELGLIAVEYAGGPDAAAQMVEGWLGTFPAGSAVIAVQNVHRHGKKVVYAKVQRP